MKQYLTEILIVACVILLLACGWFYHGREKARNEIEAARLEFAQFIVDANIEKLKEEKKHLGNVQSILEDKNNEINQLSTELNHTRNEHDNTQRLLNKANTNLRKTQQAANNGSCDDARQAARMCTDLYGKLEARTQKDEHRIGVLAEYADRLEIENTACRRYE